MSPTNQTVEGTWEEIAQQADRFAGRRVRLTILAGDAVNGLPAGATSGEVHRFISYGMFPGTVETTDEDFRSAEFHGDLDDGLDWV